MRQGGAKKCAKIHPGPRLDEARRDQEAVLAAAPRDEREDLDALAAHEHVGQRHVRERGHGHAAHPPAMGAGRAEGGEVLARGGQARARKTRSPRERAERLLGGSRRGAQCGWQIVHRGCRPALRRPGERLVRGEGSTLASSVTVNRGLRPVSLDIGSWRSDRSWL